MADGGLFDISSTFPTQPFPTPNAIQDYDGDGVVSTKDIVVYIVISLILAIIAAYLK
jgi:hypothetical protein